VGVGKFLRRADEAVQDASNAVSLGVVVAIAALIVGTVALVIAVRR
jgi:hypothetical protein